MIGQVRYVPQIFPKRGLVSALMNLSVKQGKLFFISLNIIIIIKMFQSGSFQAVLLSFLIVSIFFTLSEKAMEGLKKLLYPHCLKTLDYSIDFYNCDKDYLTIATIFAAQGVMDHLVDFFAENIELIGKIDR